MNHHHDLTARKRLLVAQASLQRMQATLAWHDVKQAVSPPATAERSSRTRTVAKWVVGIAVPLLGFARAGRIMRIMTVGLTVMRIVRGLRGTR
jgi:hypothetical protein